MTLSLANSKKLKTESMAERLAYLRLSRCETVGPVAFRRLLRSYGNAESALLALPDIVKNKKLRIPTVSEVEAEWLNLKKLGGKFLFLDQPDYPNLLSHINDAPAVLSILGQEELLHKPSFAIVGARESSLSGQKLARRFAEVLGQNHYVLVSGMAKGIDAEVHAGALRTGTVAVLAGGVDYIYPRENTGLYHDIKKLGCIISECQLGAAPLAKNFPKRNRLISGLCLGLLVIEAALKSGTLITARYALEQGRELFAVPGSPLDQRMRGCNHLIRHGAHITETPDDILPLLSQTTLREVDKNSNWDWAPTANANEQGEAALANYSEIELLKAKSLLKQNLTIAPININDILMGWQLPHGLFHQALLELELAGEVEYVGANYYCLTGEKIF